MLSNNLTSVVNECSLEEPTFKNEEKPWVDDWINSIVEKVRNREYSLAREIFMQKRDWWEDDLRKKAVVCSALYPIIQEMIHFKRDLREARNLAAYFPELKIEYWIQT